MNQIPAILGGAPLFADRLPFVRPVLPRLETIDAEFREMVSSGQLTKGRHLERFERAVAEHLQVKHAVAVSSCTTGLMLTYRGLGLKGDVVVPSFTFMATVSALVWAGLRPVFADVNYDTTNLDPESAERAITPRTSAIVAVHNFGNPAQIAELQALADRRGLKLIFDAAHGFGARYRGIPVGSQGDANIFSMSPTKLLVAGEGGVVSTNDDDLAHQIRLGREYGNDGTYDSAFAGMNARMGEFNALMGLHGLPLLEDVAAYRNTTAKRYLAELESVPGIGFQEIAEDNRSSYKDFSITINRRAFGLSRDQLSDCLAAERIETRKYYFPTVHRHTAYRGFGGIDALLPNSLRLADESLSLPIGPQIGPEQVARIGLAIRRVHAATDKIRATLEGSPVIGATSADLDHAAAPATSS
jgi:dTDP-4-amino-4,6-dideoxygalactose transaminase